MNFICVLKGYEPKRKTTSCDQMKAMIEAKLREIRYNTHHSIVPKK